MRRYALFFFLLCVFVPLRAQIHVNGAEIPQDAVIIRVTVLENAWYIELPGPKMKLKDKKEQKITSAGGQKLETVHPVNVCNFLELNGWSLMFETAPDFPAGTTYVFRRKE